MNLARALGTKLMLLLLFDKIRFFGLLFSQVLSFFIFLLFTFSDNVDGETVDCGLTETMVAYLFQGSFKQQAKFNQFVHKLKEPVVTLT